VQGETPVPDDRTLLKGVACGDQEALHQLYATYQPRLRRYLWRQFRGDLPLAEDTVQEVFLAVWRDASSFRGDASVAVWLFRIAHHCASHARRALAHRPEGNAVSLMEDEEIARNSSVNWQRASHEDAVIARLMLGDALQHLSDKHREVLALIFQQGFTLEEVAHILDIPVGTVKSHVSYARQALLRELTLASSQEDHER
jgi:RNA polymerase sigma-70 factor, ECF subfamily